MKLFTRLLNPRFQFFFFAVLALFVTGLVAFCSPEQFPIVRYKLSLGMLAAVIAVFFDMAAFPYASPDSYLDDDWWKVPESDRPPAADFPVAPGCRFLLPCGTNGKPFCTPTAPLRPAPFTISIRTTWSAARSCHGLRAALCISL